MYQYNICYIDDFLFFFKYITHLEVYSHTSENGLKSARQDYICTCMHNIILSHNSNADQHICNMYERH